ncbi:MAG: HK97 gp10 family phage protein [Alcanivorax sp.]|nr:HK97 gp10 family phage protein [Alcanivorax sp.]
MDSLSLDFIGLADLEREFELLTRAEEDRALRSAARAGAGVIRDEARERVKKRTGKLQRNIVSDTAKVTSRSRATAGVKIREEGKASDPNNAFYWKFQEFGTARHPAAPFLRPAYDAKEDEAARVAIAKALENFDKVLARG